MYKAFVAFEAPDALSPTVLALDEIIVRHHGDPVKRKHPLHLTVMAPRVVTLAERNKLEACAREFNEQYGELPARVDTLACFDHFHQKKHLVALVKGHRLETIIDRFHEELLSRFSWERRRYEGRNPHVTLLNSKHVPTHHLFECVRREALRLSLPREVSIPGLVVHIQQRKVAPQKLPEEEVPKQGWYP